uniref:LRRCT domain-containing protein n=1 Tax=Anopheles farauti TaxID=69004 RepID=A0A182QNB9_9DIPT
MCYGHGCAETRIAKRDHAIGLEIGDLIRLLIGVDQRLGGVRFHHGDDCKPFLWRTVTSAKTMANGGAGWLVLLALLVTLVWSPAGADSTSKCPLECQCETNGTIRCTSVAGVRSLEKSLPIARLDLSGLELTKIPPALENMRNITELDLSGNRLAEVSHLGRRIRKLNLSHNRITSAKLARIPLNVESLNLTHNDITYLPLHLMKLGKLRYIELAHNPINCTCETLHIRNWLTSRHVWSDQHIKCMAPADFKGQPWLQVRQQDVCNPSVVEERKGGYRWEDYEDENDLMLGDGAHLDEAQEKEDEDEDDFKREYFPVGEKVKRNEPPIVVDTNEETDGEDDASGGGPAIGESSIGVEERRQALEAGAIGDEGSGETDTARVIPAVDVVDDGEEEDGDGSGSGGGLLLGFGHISAFDGDSSSPAPIDEVGEESEEAPLEIPSISDGLGIFRDEKDEEVAEVGTTAEETTSEGAVMMAAAGVGAGAGGLQKTAILVKPEDSGAGASGTSAVEDESQDNQNTYILLAILGIIVVALIVTVVCKRKPDSRNRRSKYDVETANGQGREMKEMNKNLLEKVPAERNGHGGAPPEQTPLMAPTSDYDKVFADPRKTAFSPVKPQRASLEKPPMESFKPIAAERRTPTDPETATPTPDNNNTLPNGNGHPAGVHKPLVPSPNGDVTDADGQLAVPLESPRSKRYSPIYVPTSPKSDRYSPVYSPETGRVKIKLTETPKPKTPILVTRSRSRAGDIITTMDDQKF